MVALIEAKGMQYSVDKDSSALPWRLLQRTGTEADDAVEVKPSTWMQMKKELHTAREACAEALTAVLRWGSGLLTAMANKLEDGIPEYKPFVEDTFDSDKVKAELIEKDWQWFAEQW